MNVSGLPVEALFELEDELSKPLFMGVPLGPTLNDWFALSRNGYSPRLTLMNGLLSRARYHYRLRRGLPSARIPPALPDGQILITSLGLSDRLLGLVLPVVARLGPSDCAVIGDRALAAHLPPGIPLLEWNCTSSERTPEWWRCYRQCAAAWRRTLNGFVKRWRLPAEWVPLLAYELLIQSLRVAGSLDLLRRFRPRGVVTEHDRNELASSLVLSARRLGIPTMTMMHGVINPPYGFTPLLADVAFCWGEQQRELMKQMGTPAERLVITGCQRLTRESSISKAEARSRIGVASERPVVLLASSPIDLDGRRACAQMFCEALAQERGMAAVVRLHPSEKAAFYAREASRFPTVMFRESQGWPVSEALAAADVVVCQNSGLGNDALIYKCVVVVLDIAGESLKNGKELVEKAGCPLVRSPEALRGTVRRTLEDDEYRQSLAAQGEAFVERFCGAFGEEATTLAVAEIERRTRAGADSAQDGALEKRQGRLGREGTLEEQEHLQHKVCSARVPRVDG